MAKKYAFLFPGQGAQAQGMMKDVCDAFPEARKVIDDISAITGKDITKLLWETEQTELNRSDNSQLAITAGSLAVMAALKSKGIEPSAAMGFSLGEFPALYAAGILSFEDVIKIVVQRGSIMQKVCEDIAAANEGHAPGMTAVLGLPPEKVEELANALQVCLDSGAKKVLLPITSAADLGTVPAELIGCFNLIFYNSAEDAVFKALGVE